MAVFVIRARFPGVRYHFHGMLDTSKSQSLNYFIDGFSKETVEVTDAYRKQKEVQKTKQCPRPYTLKLNF